MAIFFWVFLGKLPGGRMAILFWVLLVSVLLLLGLVLLVPWPLRIRMRAGWGEGRPPCLQAEAAVWGLRVWAGRLPPPPGKEGRRVPGDRGRRGVGGRLRVLLARRKGGIGLTAAARAVAPAARYLGRHVRVLHLKWHTRVGLREAELCALAATALQVGQSAFGLALSAGRPASPLDLRVCADYRWVGLESVLDCRLRVSPLRVLLAGLRALAAVRCDTAA